MRLQSLVVSTLLLLAIEAAAPPSSSLTPSPTPSLSTSSSISTSHIPSVSAELTDLPKDACTECLKRSMKAVSNCGQVADNLSTYDPSFVLDPTTKRCVCALAASYTWLSSCQSQTACTARFVGMTEKAYDIAKAVVCGSSSNRTSTTSEQSHNAAIHTIDTPAHVQAGLGVALFVIAMTTIQMLL